MRHLTELDFAEITLFTYDPDMRLPIKDASANEIVHWIMAQQDLYYQTRLGFYMALDKETGKTIGLIGLTPELHNHQMVVRLYHLFKPKYKESAYVGEAVSFLLDFVFTNYSIGEVVYDAIPMNKTTVQIASRLRMKPELVYNKHNSSESAHMVFVTTKDSFY